MIHGIWNFLVDTTVCGKKIEYKRRAETDALIPQNVALELDDIDCPECHTKLEAAHANPA